MCILGLERDAGEKIAGVDLAELQRDRLPVRQGIRIVLDSGPPDPDAPQNVVRLV
ncbi:MAG: hypothetical protein JJ902_23085 [Roseibium sp.]|nr:hypothetical protein [Roseibium sp.]